MNYVYIFVSVDEYEEEKIVGTFTSEKDAVNGVQMKLLTDIKSAAKSNQTGNYSYYRLSKYPEGLLSDKVPELIWCGGVMSDKKSAFVYQEDENTIKLADLKIKKN